MMASNANLRSRMPVTAKLSRRFYERMGDDVANELVEWFNAVDATYRADLRELNESNFVRFDAKLEQRIAQLDAKIDRRTAELGAKLEQRLAEFRAELVGAIGDVRARLMTWIVGLWITSALSFAGIALTLWRLR